MPMTAKKMIKLLGKHGFYTKSHNGSSHLKMFNDETKRTVIIPVHAKELGKGLEKAILKQAGIKKP
ncbi:type II toxin-antitoxin system HicA family toxin [Apilactobacillus kunkeei]|uniref:type II toxin-antitoxin system HicA family toxin n=1 Tax=Apilactobacillus kunkeei TaxID=148814 RepID=UPI00200A93A0|nr:type II toxin-antitoxin system HicA family toxin [Apilactobacillus kunkeei]MCK8619660.1 type II toxin-antitoxin system HicA family toxin [Apilactobacillus kunkeei]